MITARFRKFEPGNVINLLVSTHMMTRRSYDKVAVFYDALSRLVYGDKLRIAQRYLVDAIPPKANILIAGGGTGWILEEIAAKHPTGLTITYIDVSARMIALSRKRSAGNNAVTFITGDAANIASANSYDVVITPFLLDNFGDDGMRQLFRRLDEQLHEGGLWLYCDFQNTGSWKQNALLRTMYLFFRICCGIVATTLPDAERCFKDHNYEASDTRTWMSGFVVATVYRKV